jgi:hypothetical protein
MLNFFNRRQRRNPTIRQALVRAGLAEAADPLRVALVEQHGNYVGRRVNFFQAFEAGHHDLLLGSGHVEHDGTVVVNKQTTQEDVVPLREPANRAIHADDNHLVFWDSDHVLRSDAILSAPAAAWRRAQSSAAPGAST